MNGARGSSLAWLQRALALLALALLGGWLWYWQGQVGWQALGVGLTVAGHALVLGSQFLLMHWRNRADPAPRPTGRELWRAWWVEVWVAPQVFARWMPWGWRRWPDTADPAGDPPHSAVAHSGERAVVLVHGYLCNRGFWRPWLQALRAQGVPYVTVNLEPVFGSIDDYAPLIDEAIEHATRATGLPPLVVAHSMGGVAVRAWWRAAVAASAGDCTETATHAEETVAARVHHVVTIGTPHHGTWLARFSHTDNGRQMSDAGDWLAALAADEPPARYRRFTCWYSSCDNIVFPASTATLAGADNRFVPGGVPHVAMAYHPRVMSESLAIL